MYLSGMRMNNSHPGMLFSHSGVTCKKRRKPMKKLRNTLLLFLLVLWCMSLGILPVAAADLEDQGLEVTVEMDKEAYSPGEPITATIFVENTSGSTVTIASLEQLIPEGYRLVETSEAAMTDVELGPYEGMSMNVTYVGEEAAEEAQTKDFFKNLFEGQTLGIPNVLLLFVAVVAVVVFMILT